MRQVDLGSLEGAARLTEVDAEPITLSLVVLHQVLQGVEHCPTSDEESTFVQLADAVVFDIVSVLDGEGVVSWFTLALTHEEGAFISCGSQELLALSSLYGPKEPSGRGRIRERGRKGEGEEGRGGGRERGRKGEGEEGRGGGRERGRKGEGRKGEGEEGREGGRERGGRERGRKGGGEGRGGGRE